MVDSNSHLLSFKTPQGEAEFVTAYDANLALWQEAPESFHANTRFGRTHLLVSGPEDAPPLLLLHGFGFGSTMWYPNIGALNRRFRTYAVDVLADINKSVVTRPFQNKADCALWLCDLLDALGLEKASFVGHSAGGWQVLNLAVHAQERLEQMVLLAPAASFVPFHKQFFFRLTAAAILRTRSYVIDSFCNWFVAKENRSLIEAGMFEQFYLGLKHFKFSRVIQPSVFTDEELQRLQVPTLLLIGDREVIYNPHKAIRRAQQMLPHLQAEIIPNASHTLSIEQADMINERMVKFLISNSENESSADRPH